MLLRNARIGDAITDIRVEGGTIIEMSSLSDGHGDDDGDGDGLDLGGRWVIPGLWDNHVHFTQWSLRLQWLDLGPAASARHAAQLVGEAIGSPSSETFVGFGFRDGLWPDKPNLFDLDAATGVTPTVLMSADLHSAWLNTAALELYGYRSQESGLLLEEDAFAVARFVARVPDATADRYALAASTAAAARGVVGIVDLEMTWNLDTWQRRQAGGNDFLRVEFGIYSADLDSAIELGLRSGHRLGDLLTVGPFKVITDGSLNTRTAYCHDTYPGTDEYGLLTVPPEQLVPLMRRAGEAGIQSAVHAIGDHANTLALDAFATIGGIGRIEHAQLVSPTDFKRFAHLGVVASVQPEHAMDDRDVADRYWFGRTDRTMALRSLLDAKATLAFGSDAPVAPLDPWVTMDAAVTRSRDGREPWHPEQSVSVAEALAASTRSTIATGQPADLVVVDADPFAAELRTMSVAATMLAGRFTYNGL